MAGFDPVTQRATRPPNVAIDIGTFDFSAGSDTVDVPTTLAKVMFGQALADLSTVDDPQQTMIGYVVGDVSDAAITFIRGGGGDGLDAKMSYMVAGY